MKNLVIVIILAALIIGCKNANGPAAAIVPIQYETRTLDTLVTLKKSDTLTNKQLIHYTTYEYGWVDSTLMAYISFSENALIRATRKEKVDEVWLFDQTLKTDTAEYQVYQIGHDVADEGSENQRFITDQWVYLDTLKKQLYEFDIANETLAQWTYANGKKIFYPVYELSPKTTAMVINMKEYFTEPTFLDTIFDRLFPNAPINSWEKGYFKKVFAANKWKLYDSSGYYKLLKSDRFEGEVCKYFNRDFYVYGTKGYAKTTVKDVVFGLDECFTSIFAFCFDKTSLAAIGDPVFCSDKLMDITYGKDYRKEEQAINKYLAQVPGDYSDSIKTKVIGHVDEFYFTYNDDFKWGKLKYNAKCKFPSRCVYMVDDKKAVISFWDEGLDLFGIPCD